MMQIEQLVDFRGGMRNAANAAEDFPPIDLWHIENGLIEPDGTIAVRLGSKRLHAAAVDGGTAGVFDGTECWGMTQFGNDLIAVFGQTIYESSDSGATWSSIQNGLTEGPWSFEQMRSGGTLYLLAGNTGGLYSWDGTTWATVATAPVAPGGIAIFNNRAYIFASGGITLYASKIDDHTVWAAPDGLVLPVQTNDADPIQAIGVVGSLLLVLRRTSTAYVDGFGNSDIIVASGARGISRSVGIMSDRTFAACGDNGAAWVSARGVELYTPDGGIQLLSGKISRLFTDSNDGIQGHVIDSGAAVGLGPGAVYLSTRNEYVFYYLYQSRIYALRYNFALGGWVHERHPSLGTDNQTNATQFSATTYSNQTGITDVIYAGPDGFARKLYNLAANGLDDMLSNGTGGSTYAGIVRTRPLDWRDPIAMKWVRDVLVTVNAGAIDVSVRVILDPNTRVTSFDGAGQATAAQSLAFGSGLVSQTKRAAFSGRARRAAVEVTQTPGNDAGETMNLYSIEAGAEVLTGRRAAA